MTNPLTQSDVKNSVTSTSTTTPLSAYQGYVMSRDIPWYGTSSTAASTIAKTATTSDTKFALVTGAKVSIKFTYENTASAPTLNVDYTGAKSIKAYGTTAPTSWWQAGDVVTFTYDGTNWIMQSSQGQITTLDNKLNNLPVSAGSTDFRGTQFRAVNSNASAFTPIEGSNIRANSAYFQVPGQYALFTDYTGGNYVRINAYDLKINGSTSVKATTDLNLPNFIRTYSFNAGGVAWASSMSHVTYLVFWTMSGIGTGIALLCISNSTVLQAAEINPKSYYKFEDNFNITVSTTYGLQLGFTSKSSNAATITLVHFNGL